MFVGLDGVIFPFASILIVLGAMILFYLTHNYRYAFPSVPNRLVSKVQSSSGRRLSTPLRHYALLLFAFFGLLQVIGIFIDFQYLAQLKSNYNEKDIASFLGLFGGVAGICELLVQLFLSSRTLQRFGVFVTIALLPITVAIFALSLVILLSLTSATPQLPIFWGMVFLKFLDELLRYTFVLSSGPLLFQPIPDKVRTKIQALASGVAEAFGAGAAGALILITLWLVTQVIPQSKTVILIETIIIALICLAVIWVLRSHYVSLLVFSAGKKQLKGTDVDLRSFKQAVIKALKENTASGDRSSCIELLSELDPQGAEAVLAPLLVDLPPDLQQLSLEKMLQRGANPTYLTQVGQLLHEENSNNITPEVSALAIRYVYLAESHPDLRKLEEYLHGKRHSIVRATAAALLLRQGTPIQQLAATRTLRWMLTHKQERERINAVKALREAVYLQVLRIYIPSLLQDKSLRVRCAVLEMIAANRLEEYYGALISGLHYKSTRNTAMTALVQLENEVLEPLFQLATNISKPQTVRMFAWRTIGQISTLEASDTIWQYLGKSKGTTRDSILQTLLK
ncbi:MAG: MFS transporter, partial [Cyanobacteria bacterium J06639_18]